MHVSEAIRLIEWESDRKSDEIRQVRREMMLLHDQINALSSEIRDLKKSLNSKADHTTADYIKDIEDDDIVF